MRYLYTLIYTLLLPVILLRLLYRSIREPGYRQNIAERFGLCARRKTTGQSIWLHAVSVGEQVAAAPLIKLLAERHPDVAIQITVTTASGHAQAKKLYYLNRV